MIYIIYYFYKMCFKFIIWMINPMISLIEHDNDDDDETNKYYKLFTKLIVLFTKLIVLFTYLIVVLLIFITGYICYIPIINIIRYIFKNKLLLNDIILEMNKLDDIKNDMTSDEYLLECNRLKSIYDRLKSN